MLHERRWSKAISCGSSSLAQINRIPFDEPASPGYPAPHIFRQFLGVLKSLASAPGIGLRPQALRFPCVAFLKGETARPAILVKRDAERVLYFSAGSQTPATVPLAEVGATFEPTAILVRHEDAADPKGDGAEAPGKFGFRGSGRSF